jgi:hypothetical protein
LQDDIARRYGTKKDRKDCLCGGVVEEDEVRRRRRRRRRRRKKKHGPSHYMLVT